MRCGVSCTFISISNVSRHVYRLIMFYVLLLIFLTQQDKTIDKLKRKKNINQIKLNQTKLPNSQQQHHHHLHGFDYTISNDKEI